MNNEYGIEDHLSLPYMGKAYKARRGELVLEISSVGIELLLGGKLSAGHRPRDKQMTGGDYTLAEALAEDRSSSWIGHVLAMLISV